MQNYYNHYESPQTTSHLECNHLETCRECRWFIAFMFFIVMASLTFNAILLNTIEEVKIVEVKIQAQIFERPHQKITRIWRDLWGK